MSYIDENIIEMRKTKSYVRTILNYVVGQCPNVDEQVCLCRICSVLDDAGLAVSRAEVRKAFNVYYSKEYHSEKQGYLNWIYTQFHIKSGTKVNTANVRPQVSQKKAISCISRGNKASRTQKSALMSDCKGIGSLRQETAHTGSICNSGKGLSGALK